MTAVVRDALRGSSSPGWRRGFTASQTMAIASAISARNRPGLRLDHVLDRKRHRLSDLLLGCGFHEAANASQSRKCRLRARDAPADAACRDGPLADQRAAARAVGANWNGKALFQGARDLRLCRRTS